MKKIFFYVILVLSLLALWHVATEQAYVVRQYKGLFENRIEEYQNYVEKLTE